MIQVILGYIMQFEFRLRETQSQNKQRNNNNKKVNRENKITQLTHMEIQKDQKKPHSNTGIL